MHTNVNRNASRTQPGLTPAHLSCRFHFHWTFWSYAAVISAKQYGCFERQQTGYRLMRNAHYFSPVVFKMGLNVVSCSLKTFFGFEDKK
jgi:hypothetical protein